MNIATIEELAYTIKKTNKKPIFFLGAGASVTGGIPIAGGMVKKILEQYSDHPKIKKLEESEKTYVKLMECLEANQRNELLKDIIDKAKINVTHIYLAQMFKEGFIDYVLTVNFDDLVLKALALYNIFPPTYDMAILKDRTTTTFIEQSVVYLHGQHHGQWLLNTGAEMNRVSPTVPSIFCSISNRPWIFLGYSGEDPIFEHIEKLGRFSSGLYWVCYKNNDPIPKVRELLNDPNKGAYCIKGYDADAFMLKLNGELGLEQPEILTKPFTCLANSLNQIIDIDDDDAFLGTKMRHRMAKEDTELAIRVFENNEENGIIKQEDRKIEQLNQELIALIVEERYDQTTIEEIRVKATAFDNQTVNYLLSCVYVNWGNRLCSDAMSKIDDDILYNQAFEKFQKAVNIKPDNLDAYNAWGIALGNLAVTKKVIEEAEKLFNQAFTKFEESIKIEPNHYLSFNNWGCYLIELSDLKGGDEGLLWQATEKFTGATKLKPDYKEAYLNWSNTISRLAHTKSGKEAEELNRQMIKLNEKYVEHGGSLYEVASWLAAESSKLQYALHFLKIALDNNEVPIAFVRKDSVWKKYLQDPDFLKVLTISE